MNIDSDYLWDRTGEPDPEIQELEEILGTLRYQPRPLDSFADPPGFPTAEADNAACRESLRVPESQDPVRRFGPTSNRCRYSYQALLKTELRAQKFHAPMQIDAYRCRSQTRARSDFRSGHSFD